MPREYSLKGICTCKDHLFSLKKIIDKAPVLKYFTYYTVPQARVKNKIVGETSKFNQISLIKLVFLFTALKNDVTLLQI